MSNPKIVATKNCRRECLLLRVLTVGTGAATKVVEAILGRRNFLTLFLPEREDQSTGSFDGDAKLKKKPLNKGSIRKPQSEVLRVSVLAF